VAINLHQDFKDFLTSLNKFEVEFILIGGYAVMYYGYARTTGDIDIWVNRTDENYRKIESAFKDFGMPVFDMTAPNFLKNEEFDVFTFGVPPVCIDLLTKVKGLKFNSAFENSSVKKIDDIEVRIISKEDLILAKKASNRPRDRDDIENLK